MITHIENEKELIIKTLESLLKSLFGDASLPIRLVGLGLYSKIVVSSYAFVPSKAHSWVLEDHILRDSGICGMDDDYVSALACLRGLSGRGFTLNRAALKAASCKVTKHENDCIEYQHVFIPFVFDPFGFLAPEAVKLLNRVQQVLVDLFKARTSGWKANLISIGERLTRIKSVLESLGIYYLSIFKVPKMVVESLESLRVVFFSGGHEDNKKIVLVKWSNILGSLDKGGLGTAIQGDEAGVDLRGCQTNKLWASIVGKINHLHSSGIVLLNSIRFQVGNGLSIRFWKDTWLGCDSCIRNLSNDDTFSVNKVRKYIDECYLPMLSPCTRCPYLYDHVNPATRRRINQSISGKLHNKNANESWALLEDLALYDNKIWNDPRDFAKLVKAISLPQDVPTTSDRHLIKHKNQVQRLMEAHLAPKSSGQVNKITSSCEICSGPMTLNIAWKILNKLLLITHPRVLTKREASGSLSNPSKTIMVTPIIWHGKVTQTFGGGNPKILKTNFQTHLIIFSPTV
uniref:RNA-directed DNA polymerase, eukaryota, reverse transcriptase zinc-binding domain protein n=1 Tax=Tanacetum cinerariifolium TaxID=118510 RepID=A0A6L2K9M5_TANCI|nr:RNA-directed DNA polymerase, eukaryota, reverse transcriptase zinc-binding domain protein [Tanacetum cinerariifolium]